jgi:hypothetical protein
MKAKEFCLGKGEYVVQATYINHNDATGEDDETTIKTCERPRPRLYTDVATLVLRARTYYGLGEIKALFQKIGFTNSDEGRFVKLWLEVEGSPGYYLILSRVKRDPFNKPGTEEPDPEHPKNLFLEAVDLVENRISEYLAGDREQPELPPKREEPEVKVQGRFGFIKERIAKGKKAPAQA